MATIDFGPGFTGGFLALINGIDTAIEAEITSFGSNQIVMTDGSRTFTLDGSNFQVALIRGEVVLVGGTLDSVTMRDGGAVQIAATDLGIAVADLAAAIQAEDMGQIDALETFLTARDWVYNGTDAADLLPAGVLSSDGVPILLPGNDTFNLGGGNDDIFAGDGRDTAFGQAGDDTLRGGRGADWLDGGTGNDLADGGAGRDKLFGGNGGDVLRGGGGDDILTGGAGRDKLIGGAGSDRFVFRAGDGTDVIRGFEDGVDVLRFSGMADPTDITDTARGALITYDGGSVLLLGIAAADITTDDFF